jgi:hypothetical protein
MTVYERNEKPQAKLGRDVANTLMHAVTKQVCIDDLECIINDLSSAYRLKDSSKQGIDFYESLLLQRVSDEDKLTMRLREANNIVSSHLDLRVTSLDNPNLVSEGRLMAVDFHEATLDLSGVGQQIHRLQFAESIPIPDKIDQTYYGHRLTVMMEVLSISKAFEWVLG